MPTNKISARVSTITYIPAHLSEGKEWFIAYYALNPSTNKLHRKKIKLNRIKSTAERRRFARETIHKINVKLASGWNPFIEQEAARGFHDIFNVVDTFLAEKAKELRTDSMRCYSSYCKIFLEYIEKEMKLRELFVISFSIVNAVNFMEWVYAKPNISNRAFNNYQSFFVSLFNWMMSKQYCKVNPFVGITKKKKQEKKRGIIDDSTLMRLITYLEKNNYNYLIICFITYYCLIRPKEITYLRICDINIDRQVITLPGSATKNGKPRTVTIPNELMPYLAKIDLVKFNKTDYLCSTGFGHGKVQINGRDIARRWDQLRKTLNMPMEFQFYSLKDTGIVEMLNAGISAESVRKQADHHSLAMTTIYSNHANPKGDEQLKQFKPIKPTLPSS